MEIDCNLTKRLWAPDCTHAKVWFGGQGAELESGLRCNAEEKSFRKLKRPLLVFLPPLGSSVSFQSLINHPVCVLIHLHPPYPLFPHRSPPAPSLIDVSLPVTPSLHPESPRRRTVEVVSLDGSLLLERNPFAVVSPPVDSYVCDSFCTPFFLFWECSGTVLFPPHAVAP